MGNSSSSISSAERKPSPPRARSPPPPSAAEAAPRPPEIDLKRIFNKFDADGDGRIREAEVAAMLTRLGCDDDAASMVAAADADGDGYIDMGEFAAIFGGSLEEAREVEAELRAAFAVFDEDGDGGITAEELFRVLEKLGEGETMDRCREMVRGVDRNGDGVVSFEEFRLMMTQEFFASSPRST
ncbi:probable calcium-binding protein CML15 [Ananas comosus]|uniref:Probable calcium-binding protein CML15 n=1 Tax=Ananas comosus TaxID=4615 RepID=A0A6P5F3Z9_ANACO|nr:probable calcium-binding protein CML15 [Ananas comosus]